MSNVDDEDSDDDSHNSPIVAAGRRGKFDDEEDDSDVLESWDAAEDSEVEREKAKKAEAAKAKADAEAKANHKTKTQRRVEHIEQHSRDKAAMSDSDDEEDDATKRERLRRDEMAGDLRNAEDLFGNIGISNNRGSVKPVTVQKAASTGETVDLASLPLFNAATRADFVSLRATLVPLLVQHSKKAEYVTSFLPEFVKDVHNDLTAEQIKKSISLLTTLSNLKMKEEKASDKGGKKTKAAKTKTSLSSARDTSKADTTLYDDGGLDE